MQESEDAGDDKHVNLLAQLPAYDVVFQEKHTPVKTDVAELVYSSGDGTRRRASFAEMAELALSLSCVMCQPGSLLCRSALFSLY